jgi:hypothetical protein
MHSRMSEDEELVLDLERQTASSKLNGLENHQQDVTTESHLPNLDQLLVKEDQWG